jgi:hypothetical protein
MAIQLQGSSGVVGEVDSARRPQRVVLEPNGGTELVGHYVIGEATGIVATPAAAAEIFQFRNSHASNLVIVERVVVAMVNAAAVTAAQEFGFDIIRSTGWSAQGTGGTALDTRPKRRTSLTNSSMAAGDIRIASTAALGAGTKTFDTLRIASGPGPSTNAIGAAGPIAYFPEDDVRYPAMVLANNEGFSVRNLVTYATGSARFHVRVFWREVTSY